MMIIDNYNDKIKDAQIPNVIISLKNKFILISIIITIIEMVNK